MMNLQEKLRALSPTDFAALGMNDLAYVKPVIVEDQNGFAIHAADGTTMAVVTDHDVAFAAIRQHELEPVNVH